MPNFYASARLSKETDLNQDNQEKTVEWYKAGKNSSMKSKNVSLRKYQVQKKFYAKPEELYCNDFENNAAKQDCFKENRRIKF